jgi:uncharacterized membrane protein YdjX (TVP38/TMEM64 family)
MTPPLESLSENEDLLPKQVSRWAGYRFLALLLLLVLVSSLTLATDLRGRFSATEIQHALDDAGPWAPVALLTVFAIRPLTLFPLTPLWIAAGAFFGWLEGGIWASVGTLLGGSMNFALARHLGRDFVERQLGERVGRWARMGHGKGFRSVLLLKLNPLVPDGLINNLAGVSRMAFASFALASLLGVSPLIFLYSYIGTTLWEYPSPTFWIGVGILTALTIVLLFWSRVARIWRRSRTRAQGGVS